MEIAYNDELEDEFKTHSDDFDYFGESLHDISKLTQELQNIKNAHRNTVMRNADVPLKNEKLFKAEQQDVQLVFDENWKAENDRGNEESMDSIWEFWNFAMEMMMIIAEEVMSKVHSVYFYIMEMVAYFCTLIDDGIAYLWPDNLDFSTIKTTLSWMLGNGLDAVSPIVTSFANFFECDIWAFSKCFVEYFVSLAEMVGNQLNAFLVYTLDILPNWPSAVGELIVSLGYDDLDVFESVQKYCSYGLVTLNDISDSGKDSLLAFYDVICSLQVSFDFSSVSGSVCRFCHDAIRVALSVLQYLTNAMDSVYHSQLVLILKEEVMEPIHNYCLDLYNQFVCPLVQCLTNVFTGVLKSLSKFMNVASGVVSRYTLNVKKANDRLMKTVLDLIHKLYDFVHRCHSRECLSSVLIDFIQGEHFFCKLTWIVVYLILALTFLYGSYVSNRVTVMFCFFLVKSIMKGILTLLYIIFKHKKSQKGKSKLVDCGGCCDFDQFNVRLSDCEYNELMEASVRKVEQLRKIMELENELEEMKAKNLAASCEMYLKQGELNELVAFVNTDEL